MKVQVYSYIWGFKGSLVAEVDHTFEIWDTLLININISQSGAKWKALGNNFVFSNRTVHLTSNINGSQLFRKSANTYTWSIDDHSYKPSDKPYLSVNFKENKVYKLTVYVTVNVTLEQNVNNTIVKTGKRSLSLVANNGINQLSVIGNIVYESTPRPSLITLVIIPVVSSILAIVMFFVGIYCWKYRNLNK